MRYIESVGTKSELDLVIGITLSNIRQEFSVDQKTARRLLSESLLRNVVINELYGMCEYLLSDEEVQSDEQ